MSTTALFNNYQRVGLYPTRNDSNSKSSTLSGRPSFRPHPLEYTGSPFFGQPGQWDGQCRAVGGVRPRKPTSGFTSCTATCMKR